MSLLDNLSTAVSLNKQRGMDLEEARAAVAEKTELYRNSLSDLVALRNELKGSYVVVLVGRHKGKTGKVCGFTEDYILVDVQIPGPITTVYPTYSFLPEEIEVRKEPVPPGEAIPTLGHTFVGDVDA